jgi:hypothetical protein
MQADLQSAPFGLLGTPPEIIGWHGKNRTSNLRFWRPLLCLVELRTIRKEQEERPGHPGMKSGGLYGNRTHDNILDREVLYQLS